MSTAVLDRDKLDEFTKRLFQKMKLVAPAVRGMELYEFRYGLNNLIPDAGWSSVVLKSTAEIEQQVNSRSFYDSLQIKPSVDGRIVLDGKIVELTNMLFVGLVTGEYPLKWVSQHFYFDVRGFYFLHRTQYFTEKVLSHLGNQPYRQFKPGQKQFERYQDVGYRDFKRLNQEVDALFIDVVKKLIKKQGPPVLLAIAGPTAAGKTEIVERLHTAFHHVGQKTTSIEMDNFLTDRDYREARGIHTQGKAALHFELLKSSLAHICQGQKISIPRYDFIYATSSHDLDGNLKPGGIPIEIEPADIIFMEGNFPFLIEEIAHLVNIKVVYLTDDPVRMKRKWKRDIDYRKKYEPTYFRNRFFKEQFIMAQIAFIPQLETCDILVDTTGAALWTTPGIKAILDETIKAG
jgi:uridine kinase